MFALRRRAPHDDETLLGLLAPILAELRDAHPGILVEVVTSNAFFI